MMPSPRVDISKPKEFKRDRSAKEVDNFIRGLDQYFDAVGMKDDETKIRIATMYLSNAALVWWRNRFNDER